MRVILSVIAACTAVVVGLVTPGNAVGSRHYTAVTPADFSASTSTTEWTRGPGYLQAKGAMMAKVELPSVAYIATGGIACYYLDDDPHWFVGLNFYESEAMTGKTRLLESWSSNKIPPSTKTLVKISSAPTTAVVASKGESLVIVAYAGANSAKLRFYGCVVTYTAP